MRSNRVHRVFFAGLVLTFLSTAASAQDPVAVGGEIQVNTITTGYQRIPSVAMSATGEFVVVWESYDEDAGGFPTIRGQRFAADGSVIDGEFPVTSFTTSLEEDARVAVDPTGGFVVVWESESYDRGPSATDIQARRFASDGSPVGDPFLVNSYTSFFQSKAAIAMDSTGGFVVAWQSSHSAYGVSDSIQAQRFASDGTPTGGQFQVNTYLTSSQIEPAVAMSPSGDFVIVWESYGSTGSDTDLESVQGQRYASDGTTLGGEFQVNTYTTFSQEEPDVAYDIDGGFLVTWRGHSAGDSNGGIQGQRFASDGSAVGGELQINSDPNRSQSEPAIAADGAGHFVVTWWSGSFDGQNIVGRRLASDGSSEGGEFQVNTYTTGDKLSPAIAMKASGDFVIAWHGYGSAGDDQSESSVHAQRFRVTGGAGDRVWFDADFDGIQDAGEEGLAGVRVNAYDDLGMQVATTDTDVSGSYLFFELEPGDYFLEFELPPSHSFTIQDAGDEAFDSDADPVTGQTIDFAVEVGVDELDWDAGMAHGVGDFVWSDADGNGIQDAGELGVAGVTVRLLDDQGAQLDETLTDADGRYGFAPGPGDYILEFVPPPAGFFAPQDQGGNDALDSDVDPATGRTSIFSLALAQIDTGRDAGLEFLPIFEDGFESGDTTAWSSSVP